MGESMYSKKKPSSLPASTSASKSVSWRRPFPEKNTYVQPQSEDKADEQVQPRRQSDNVISRLNHSLDLPYAMKPIQTKLTVGAPGDKYEQEADRVADQVMSMGDRPQSVQREVAPEEEEIQTKAIADSITPLVQREMAPEEEEIQPKLAADSIQREEMPEEEEVQDKSLGNIQREEIPEEEEPVQMKPSLQRSSDGNLQAGSNLESRLSSSKGGGSALPDEVRSFMEPRFGADFSQVRVHTNSEAVQMNRDLNAQAFTHKQDVYFGAGKTPTNDALTAHELTHVVQQIGGVQKQTFEQSLVQSQCSACENEDMQVRRSVEISGDQESKVRRDGEEECCAQEREKEQAASRALSDAEDDVEKKTEASKTVAALHGIDCVGTFLAAANSPTPMATIGAAINCVGKGFYGVKSPLIDLKMARRKLGREEAAYGKAGAKLNYCAANCDSSQKVSPPTPELYQ